MRSGILDCRFEIEEGIGHREKRLGDAEKRRRGEINQKREMKDAKR